MEKTYIVTKALWTGQEFTPVGQRFNTEGKKPDDIQNLVRRGFIAEEAQVEQAANPQAFDYKQQFAQAQARVAELEGQLASGEAGEEVSGLLESNHALKADLDEMEKAAKGFGQQVQTLKEQLTNAQTRGDEATGKLSEVQGQLVTAEAQRDEATGKLDELARQVEDAQAERDQARQALQDGKMIPEDAQMIPEDALERLIAVRGIGQSLATEALAALTAPAQAEQ